MKTITMLFAAALLALSASTASAAWDYYYRFNEYKPQEIPHVVICSTPNFGNCK